MKMRNFCFVLFALLVTGIVQQVSAATYTWVPTAAGTYDWSTGSNWKIGSTVQSAPPTSTDAVSIPNISNVQIINLPSTSFTVASLTMSTTGAGSIKFSSSGAVTITTTSTVSMTSSSLATSGQPGFRSDQSVTYNVGTGLTITNTRVDYALKTVALTSTVTGTVFLGAYELIMNTSATGNSNCGGNTFYGNLILENKSSGNLSMGVTNPDVYHGTVVTKHTGTGNLHLSYSSTGNTFKQPITFYSTGGGGLTYMGNGNGTSILDSVSCLTAVAGNITAGGLNLKNITKTTTVASTLVVDATGSSLTLGPAVFFKGDLDITAPSILQNSNAAATADGTGGCNTFEGNVSFTKTGTADNTFAGGNWFKQNVRYTNASTSTSTYGALVVADGLKDVVKGNLTAENLSNAKNLTISSNMSVDGDIIVSNVASPANAYAPGILNIGTAAGDGLKISGTSVIRLGTNGMDGAQLYVYNLQQDGAGTHPDITLTLNTTAIFIFDGVVLNSKITLVAKRICLLGGTFNAISYFEQTGVNNNNVTNATGNILFAENTTLVNNGTGGFYLGASDGKTVTANKNLTFIAKNNSGNISICFQGNMIVQGDLIIKHEGGTQVIYVNANATSVMDVYGNIILSKTVTGTGSVQLGYSGLLKHYGTSTVQIDNTLGYLDGNIMFRSYQQVGTNADINIAVTTGALSVYFLGASIFKCKVNIEAPSFYIKSGTFQEDAVLVKNGTASNNPSSGLVGALSFLKNFTLTNNGTGYVYVGSNTDDVCTIEGNLNLNKSATSGNIGFARMGITYLKGNFTRNIASASNLALGNNGGLFVFNGSADQYVNCNVPNNLINQLKIDKSSGDVIVQTGNVYLQNNNAIAPTITFVKGKIILASGLLVVIENGGSTSGASALSFVSGPINKKGSDAFVYPIGKGNFYAPLAISAPCNSSINVIVEYMLGAHASTYTGTLSSGLADISNVAYWSLTCANTFSCSIAVTLPWNTGNYEPVNKSIMTVARYNSGVWSNAGNASSTGDNTSGTVTATSTTSFVGDYCLGYKTAVIVNALNVYQTKFKTSGANIDYFREVTASPGTTFVSQSGGSSIVPYAYTRLAVQNPQKMVIHPSVSTSCAQIDIVTDATTTNYLPVSLCLVTDGSGNVSGINTTSGSNAVSSDYYTFNTTTKELIFYPNKKPDAAVGITNNLVGGVIWKKTSNPTLSFTVGGNTFAYVNLKVTPANGGSPVFNSAPSYTGSNLNWSGSGITADGLYIYELTLGQTSGTAQTYTGNMVVKMAE